MPTREFEFKDATSDKFWKITLDDKSHTVHFGRRGTAGQQQTKEFGSDAEARKSHDKLVAEKVGKGYVETTSGATAPLVAAAPKPKPAAPKPPDAPAPAVPPSAPAVADRRIDLDPLDWAVATWRKVHFTPLPPPAPFDLEGCFSRLRRFKYTTYGWEPVWSSIDLAASVSPEEGHFWFDAVLLHEQEMPIDAWEKKLRGRSFDGSVTMEDVARLLGTRGASHIGPEISVALRSMIPAQEMLEFILRDGFKGYQVWAASHRFLQGFRRFIVPGLLERDADVLRARLRSELSPSSWPSDVSEVPCRFLVAASLGMHTELQAVVESWKDGLYGPGGWGDYYHLPQLVVFGLGNAELVDRHMRRTGLQLKSAEHVKGWLAHTEWNALDFVKDCVIAQTNRDECEKLVDVLHRVHAPEVAGTMLEIKVKSKAAKSASEWFEKNPAHTAAGLPPVAGGSGPFAETAVEMLRSLQKRGFRIPLSGVSAEAADKLRREVVDYKEVPIEVLPSLPDWLAKGVEEAPKKFKPPGWAAPDTLPPLLLDDKKLPTDAVTSVLATIQATALETAQPFLQKLRESLDVLSRDAFAWKLFERWQAEGAPSKDKWAMAAIGWLGGDESVLKLAPLIRVWPGEAQHQRAVLGLEVLRRIGSDAALMQLNGIAQKLKFQGLKTKAREFMEAIAESKGLTRSELEDRIVPDCDLDERGRKVFEAGGKTYEFVLGPEMKPMVKDPAGKLRPDLPDSAGEELSAEWKLMKKQIKEVAAIQAVRLEQAMVTGRRWKAADFELMILKHPLMTHLARLLVWGVYDANGKASATFRATAEQDLADSKDEPFKLPADAQVGLVHSLHLDDETKRAWGQQFADYELIPPFLQIGRGVHRLQPGEEKGNVLKRFDGTKVPAPSLVHTLEKLGWVRGLGGDGGGIDEHSRQFPGSGLTVFLSYEGAVGMGYIDSNELVEMKGACFLPGLRKPSYYEKYEKEALPLKDVDPVVLSETIHDLEIVAAKGKP